MPTPFALPSPNAAPTPISLLENKLSKATQPSLAEPLTSEQVEDLLSKVTQNNTFLKLATNDQ